MNQLLASLLSFILLYKYTALFVVLLISNVIFVLPSNALILMAGVFAGTNYLNFYWSLLIILSANTTGDFLIYYLARLYPRWIDGRLHRQKISILERLEKFIKSSACSTIIISRFSGLSAIIVSLLSGLALIPWFSFLFYDMVGNFLVAILLLYSGFIIGADWDGVFQAINIISLILSIIITGFFAYKALSKNNHNNKNKKI